MGRPALRTRSLSRNSGLGHRTSPAPRLAVESSGPPCSARSRVRAWCDHVPLLAARADSRCFCSWCAGASRFFVACAWQSPAEAPNAVDATTSHTNGDRQCQRRRGGRVSSSHAGSSRLQSCRVACGNGGEVGPIQSRQRMTARLKPHNKILDIQGRLVSGSHSLSRRHWHIMRGRARIKKVI